MDEVAPRTGGGTRYADAVAFNLWESRGHSLIGFEIKVSRGDWLRELKSPEKAEPVMKFCDFWYVIAPRGVVELSELPLGWGLMEAQGSRLVTRQHGKQMQPAELTRGFFASLMRRGFETLDERAAQIVAQAVIDARAHVDRRVKSEVEERTRFHERLKNAADEFERVTGMDFTRYATESNLETLRLAKSMGAVAQWNRDGYRFKSLNRDLVQLQQALTSMQVALESFANTMQPKEERAEEIEK